MSGSEASSPEAAPYVRVAVPVPLAESLTYGVPEALLGAVPVGARVRVRLGRRRVTGVVVGIANRAPEGITIRDIDELVDAEPVLSRELLALAEFVTDYYQAPPGEVLRAFVPARLAPQGTTEVRLTRRGAFAEPSSPAEKHLLERLHVEGRAAVVELEAELRELGAPDGLREALERGWVRSTAASRRGPGKYIKAVELSTGTREELLERCGREGDRRIRPPGSTPPPRAPPRGSRTGTR